ncbi:MAG: shikimate kinase [Candidatus Phytoplasma sp.]|nr:shikimate kinase [Phytoplasma sp.]
MRIYIIGMPGSGKTTISQLLSKKLNYHYHDLDSEIEKSSLMFIDQIFSQHGEETFRRLESKALEKTIDLKQTVISCGGGIVTKKENKKYMKNGYVIYLETDLEIIKKRLKEDQTRPLLKTNTLEDIYQKRFFKYRDFAHWIVSNNGKAEETTDSIIQHLKEGGLL